MSFLKNIVTGIRRSIGIDNDGTDDGPGCSTSTGTDTPSNVDDQEQPTKRKRLSNKIDRETLEAEMKLIAALVDRSENDTSEELNEERQPHITVSDPNYADSQSFPQELIPFLDKLMPWQLLTLVDVWPDSEAIILPNVFEKQKFLWLCPIGDKRFLERENCCDSCDRYLDVSKFCGRVRNRQHLTDILNSKAYSSFVFNELKCLRLFRFNIDDLIAKKLVKICPQVIHLDLTECRIDYSKPFADGFPMLEHLILSSTGIDSDRLAYMITRRIKKDGVSKLTLRPNLKTIALNGTNIDERDLLCLPRTIDRLDVRCCPKLAKNNSLDFFRTGFNLKVLRCEVLINDYEFKKLSENMRSLKILELYSSEDKPYHTFSDKGLAKIARLEELITLKFVGHWNLVPIPIRCIVDGCKNITSFTIDNFNANPIDDYSNLSSEDLKYMTVKWSSNLKKLELKNVNGVDNSVIEGLVVDLDGNITENTTLSHLDLTRCARIGNDRDQDEGDLINSLNQMKALRYLIVDYCHKVTKKTFDAVLKMAEDIARSHPTDLFTTSFIRCDLNNTAQKYFKLNELPNNLRFSASTARQSNYRTFDGLIWQDFPYKSLYNVLKDEDKSYAH